MKKVYYYTKTYMERIAYKQLKFLILYKLGI